MKLSYSVKDIAREIYTLNQVESEYIVDTVYFDSRKIYHAQNGIFFCLKSDRRDGHEYILDAYNKGIRIFVIDKDFEGNLPQDGLFLRVTDTLSALQSLATFHRNHFSYPVIGITGSTGKTTVKEWLYQLLQPHFKIVRSPKSYNSQLGVALSLLEMSDDFNLAIIEAGISKPGEMIHLEKMIRPTIGIFTNVGTAHLENFNSESQIFEEKNLLFKHADVVYLSESLRRFIPHCSDNQIFPDVNKLQKSQLKPWTLTYYDNILLTVSVTSFLTNRRVEIQQINNLPQLAMRMEVFDGINDTTIINDAYNLDLEALRQSLEFLVTSNNRSKTVVLIVASDISTSHQQAVEKIVSNYPIDELLFVRDLSQFDYQRFSDCSILIKGYRNNNGQKLAQLFKLMKHETVVEVDMNALRENLNTVRSKLLPQTKVLAMVKAFAYGTDAIKIAPFLERNNVDYLGVAYGDEGVALRDVGVKTPILVLNAEPFSYENIIRHQLEPAIFSFKSLDNFIKTLINLEIENYPIHLTFDTGMHRLGFNPEEKEQVLEMLKSQPEVRVQGIYMHLADADNFEDEHYSLLQLERFKGIIDFFREKLPYDFLAHVLNSEGIMRFPDHQYDMVRLGIGLYGYISNKEMDTVIQPVISWKTIISQIRELEVGETISYNRRFTTTRKSKIATIPVGYADGLRRAFNQNGEGFVFINHKKCAVVGTICMDMCMVDVTDIVCQEGDEVVIIGKEQSLDEVARQMKTIPYEVLTSISKRVHRVYVNEN